MRHKNLVIIIIIIIIIKTLNNTLSSPKQKRPEHSRFKKSNWTSGRSSKSLSLDLQKCINYLLL